MLNKIPAPLPFTATSGGVYLDMGVIIWCGCRLLVGVVFLTCYLIRHGPYETKKVYLEQRHKKELHVLMFYPDPCFLSLSLSSCSHIFIILFTNNS